MKEDKRLNSWKEIAHYLGCSTRTCVRWAGSFGLPVRCLKAGKAASRVFAYKSELDEWMKNRSARGNIAASKEIPVKKISKRSLGIFGLIIVLFGTIFLIFIVRSSPPQPEEFRIDGSIFICLDRKGNKLWSFETGIPNLSQESFYRQRFQRKNKDSSEDIIFPSVIIEDLDDDKGREVLFSIRTRRDSTLEKLICLDRDGESRWEFLPGREMVFGNETFSRNYALYGLSIFRDSPRSQKKILVIANHKPRYPTHIVVLDPIRNGNVCGEYWNVGRISDFAFNDLDGDGKTEILLAGTNNEYNAGCLIVLESYRVLGGSPQGEKYMCKDIETGQEKAYFLFPKLEIDSSEFQREYMTNIEFLDSTRFQLNSINGSYFVFNKRLQLEKVYLTDDYRRKHRKYHLSGEMPHRKYDEQKNIEEIKSKVRVFRQNKWYKLEEWNKAN